MSKLPYLTYSVTEDPWDPDELGNHRAVILVEDDTDIARARIPWRRRDTKPEEKGILIFSERGSSVENYLSVSICGAYGEFLFEPVDGPGRYFFYFLPYVGNVKVPYPKAEYLSADIGESQWRTANRKKVVDDISEAKIEGLECVDDFNRFTEMELIADEEELAALYARHTADQYILFPEYRTHSIRMFNAIPHRWVEADRPSVLTDNVHRGEMYIFQIGLYAHRSPLSDVEVRFDDLTDSCGTVASFDTRCFNTDGRSWDGRTLEFDLSVEAGYVQPLWCGISIREDAAPGDCSARISVTANGVTTSFPVDLTVLDEVIAHHGDDDHELLARLRWIDSDIGTDDEIVPPYTPVTVEGNRIGILGREIKVAQSGLPEQITSFFSDDLNSATDSPLDLLSGPMTFEVLLTDGRTLPFVFEAVEFTKRGASFVTWHTESRADPIKLTIDATMEFDGTVEYGIRLTSTELVEVADIRLTATFYDDVAKLTTGLGRKGGATPDAFSWNWDVRRNQDAVWIGTVNGGVQFTFKDKRYSRPLNTNFYQMKPLVMPDSWCNEHKGRIELKRSEGQYRMCSSSGPRTLTPGLVLDFDMRLLVSPFKPLDSKDHFETRYFHKYEAIDEVVARGANTINIHHATDINPYINYPFLTPELMTAYIDEAHGKDCRVKLYYTTRELTTRTPEFFALKSLGHEIFVDGEGGGHAWLQEHLDGGYLSAWYALEKRDTSAINGVVSRWHNFYVEGMNWLAENLGIDGVYIDDIGFGREIMKRVRRVLHHHRDNPVIDFHSANQYNERDGFASSTNLYMEHFPFLDRLWFGEYFDYDETPEYWLLEISGIPFGLQGEMLQDGGNPWRGMIFGMTGRMPRVQNEALWRMWDLYELSTAKMIGFWSASCPVTLSSNEVKSTIYIGDRYSIVALASWAKEETHVRLDFDWKKAGVEKTIKKMLVPAIEGFQDGQDLVAGDELALEPGKGLLVVLEH